MRICVVGCGAIGGLIAVKLDLAGEEVSIVDQGPHLEAIKRKGLHLYCSDRAVRKANVKAFDHAAQAGKQDLVVLAVKAYDLQSVSAQMRHLLGPKTAVMTVQNGIPWWYFYKHKGAFEGRQLESLDPGGVLSKEIAADRIVGCVSYPAAALAGPGIIQHVEGDHFPVGELDGSETERVKAISGALIAAGLRSRVLTDIRSEIWLKAWGVLAFNPISALTHATMAQICRFTETRELAIAMMSEAQSIAAKLGVTFRRTIEQRLEGAEKVGQHKTSMLQDLENGNPLEIEALIGAILELGKLSDTPTPVIRSVYALIRLLDRTSQKAHAEGLSGPEGGADNEGNDVRFGLTGTNDK